MNYHDQDDQKIQQFLKAKSQELIIPDPVQLAVENALSSLSGQEIKRKTFRKRMRWAAAVVLLCCTLGTITFLTVPTVAEVFRSLFAKDNPDVGLLRAQELGLVHNPHIRVKDKGYTLVIEEVVADPTRVTMALQLFDKKGHHVREKLLLDESNQIIIKDADGNIVDNMYDMGYTSDFYYMVVFFKEPLQTDKITIEGNIDSLGKRDKDRVEGNWDFSFDMDMTEANKMTRTEALSGSYTTPHGMTITLKQMTRMVQGVRFELETELDETAMNRSPGDLWIKQMLSFHFETMDHEEIHSVNPRKSGYMDSLMASDYTVIGHGKIRWSYIFKYLPDDEPFRFVLDGYAISETDGSQMAFAPGEQDETLKFILLNDHIEVLDTSIVESDLNKGSKELAVSFYGEMENETTHEKWKAYDSAGHSYDVSKRGASRLYKNSQDNNWKDGVIEMGDRSMKQPYEYRITLLDHIPERLTLVREIVDKRYKDTDWSIVLNSDTQ
ncbi:DUF4179 domain-containing protein [Paenibacillus hubeiensis]|uniref:DUF4179 domain-containing protein n=1 Tax=Paenibacillus hubeiensis TaxID=3077330 RepID=UPI0031BB2398